MIALRVVGSGRFECKSGGGEAGEGECFAVELCVRWEASKGQAARSGDGRRHSMRGAFQQREVLELKVRHGGRRLRDKMQAIAMMVLVLVIGR